MIRARNASTQHALNGNFDLRDLQHDKHSHATSRWPFDAVDHESVTVSELLCEPSRRMDV